jgi:hypothetical protein
MQLCSKASRVKARKTKTLVAQTLGEKALTNDDTVELGSGLRDALRSTPSGIR